MFEDEFGVDNIKMIRIKYFNHFIDGENKKVPTLNKITKGDWIDLRSAIPVRLKKGQNALIPLGVAMQLPVGYEAIVAPRSSTFKKYHVIQTNSIGVIDNSYCGDNDEWLLSVYAIEDTFIPFGDRICQFRIQESAPQIQFNTVDHLDANDRGGFGSTGEK